MTCKENCLYYEICSQFSKADGAYCKYYDFSNQAEKCKLFKDKSKLIDLPCKLNEHVFIIPTNENHFEEITEMKVIGFAIGEPCNVANCFRIKGTSALFQPSFDEFGKTVFLTRKEAERALEEGQK